MGADNSTCQPQREGVGPRPGHIFHSIHISQILHVVLRSFHFPRFVGSRRRRRRNQRLTAFDFRSCLAASLWPCLYICICIRSNAQQFKMWFSLIYKRHIALTIVAHRISQHSCGNRGRAFSHFTSRHFTLWRGGGGGGHAHILVGTDTHNERPAGDKSESVRESDFGCGGAKCIHFRDPQSRAANNSNVCFLINDFRNLRFVPALRPPLCHANLKLNPDHFAIRFKVCLCQMVWSILSTGMIYPSWFVRTVPQGPDYQCSHVPLLLPRRRTMWEWE